jgi:hypothetical protein
LTVSRIVTPDARCVRGAIQRYTSSGRVFEVSRRTQPMAFRMKNSFEGRGAPELLDQADGAVEIQPLGCLPGDPPDVGERRPQEVHVALEVALLARRAFRRAGAFELLLDRPRELRGIDGVAHASFL